MHLGRRASAKITPRNIVFGSPGRQASAPAPVIFGHVLAFSLARERHRDAPCQTGSQSGLHYPEMFDDGRIENEKSGAAVTAPVPCHVPSHRPTRPA
jgi:hypothetical protein